jgi:hypothetical protein
MKCDGSDKLLETIRAYSGINPFHVDWRYSEILTDFIHEKLHLRTADNEDSKQIAQLRNILNADIASV